MSTRVAERWRALSGSGRKALIPYLTPEYPMTGATVPVLEALAAAGADLIEVGLPYADPLADGPTIQASSEVALKNGATTRRVLERIAEFRRSNETPVLLMGYVNSFLRYGLERFAADAAHAGVDGIIIPDLPPEESTEVVARMRAAGLSMVFLIAPTTPNERIERIDALSTDFSYCVSVTGVTGARRSLVDADLMAFLERVRANTRKRFVVGFGISSAEHVRSVWREADGAVVGSALLQSMRSAGSIGEAATVAARTFKGLRPS